MYRLISGQCANVSIFFKSCTSLECGWTAHDSYLRFTNELRKSCRANNKHCLSGGLPSFWMLLPSMSRPARRPLALENKKKSGEGSPWPSLISTLISCAFLAAVAKSTGWYTLMHVLDCADNTVFAVHDTVSTQEELCHWHSSSFQLTLEPA